MAAFRWRSRASGARCAAASLGTGAGRGEPVSVRGEHRPGRLDAGSPAVGVTDGDVAPVRGDQAVGDVHAEPRAAPGAVLPELREDALPDRGADPLALVLHHDVDVRPALDLPDAGGHAHLSLAVPDGVVDEVREHL